MAQGTRTKKNWNVGGADGPATIMETWKSWKWGRDGRMARRDGRFACSAEVGIILTGGETADVGDLVLRAEAL